MGPKATNDRIRDALETQWKRKAAPVVALYLPFPISTNRLYRRTGGGVFKSARYRTWCKAAGVEINRQRPGRIKGAYRVRVVLEQKPGRKRIDQDNGLKCLFDALEEHGVIDNDRLTVETHVSWSEYMKGAYVVLTAVASGVARRAA